MFKAFAMMMICTSKPPENDRTSNKRREGYRQLFH